MLCLRELRFGTPQAILSVTGSNPRLSDSGSLASMVRLARRHAHYLWVPKLAGHQQIADFSERAPNFGSSPASPNWRLESELVFAALSARTQLQALAVVVWRNRDNRVRVGLRFYAFSA
jgi:hypothetical protein